MDKAVRLQASADELRAARECLSAAMNNLEGSHGKAYARCVSDLYYASYHLANALLLSRGIAATSHEAVQTLLALHFVKPAALPRDTAARLNDLMAKRHTADYKPHIEMGSDDIESVRPWIVGFAHSVLDLLGDTPPADLRDELRRAVGTFQRVPLA